jgi:murein DD-endopeptidase MepM/ murein hydrolase activator NlpD
MTGWTKRARIPIAAGALLLAIASLPALASPHGRLRDLHQRQATVHSKIRRLGHRGDAVSSQVRSLDRQRAAAQHQVRSFDRRLATLDVQIGRLRGELQKARKRIGTIHEDLLGIQGHLVRRTEIFTRRARAIYEAGPNAMMDGLLSSQNFGDLLDRYTYYQAAVVSDHDLLGQITGLRDQMQSRQEEAHAQGHRLHQAEKRLTDTRQRVSAARDQRRAVVAERRKAVSDKRALLDRIQANKATSRRMAEQLSSEVNQVKDIIAAAEAAAAAQAKREQQQQVTPPPSAPSAPTSAPQVPAAPAMSTTPSSGGRLAWPASGPVTSGFGMRVDPVTHVYQLHSGIDIAAGYGATVSAADDGTVIYVGTMSGYGNVVVIDHGGGLSTLYAHLSSYSVAEGQAVSRGSPIARVGCTGYCTGPHLHFEVRINGTPTDPMPYLR